MCQHHTRRRQLRRHGLGVARSTVWGSPAAARCAVARSCAPALATHGAPPPPLAPNPHPCVCPTPHCKPAAPLHGTEQGGYKKTAVVVG